MDQKILDEIELTGLIARVKAINNIIEGISYDSEHIIGKFIRSAIQSKQSFNSTSILKQIEETIKTAKELFILKDQIEEQISQKQKEQENSTKV